MEDRLTLFYDFGPFRLDAREGTLLRDGQRVHLTQRGYEALLMLIRNRDRVVDKNELLNTLWPDSDVEENNLNQLISGLRKALDDRRRERYIKTVPKRGYRFIAYVAEVSDDAKESVAETPDVQPVNTNGREGAAAEAGVEISAVQEVPLLGGSRSVGRGRRFLKLLIAAGVLLLLLVVSNIVVRVARKPAGYAAPPPGETVEHSQTHRGKVEVDVWWPKDGIRLSGSHPFKAIATNLSLQEYTMYWQVDGDRLNPLANSYDEYPHKEVLVDLSGWNWRGDGPYKVNFVAKDANGNTIAERGIMIYVKPE
jgi:DNA-binding winged helix-turn-helix (wHTH) protein